MLSSSPLPNEGAARQQAKGRSPKSANVVGDMAITGKSRSRPITLLIVGAIVLVAAIVLGTAMMIYNSRNRVLLSKERELQNVALVLAAQVDRIFEAAERVQTNLIERFEARGILSKEDFKRQLAGYDVHLMLKDKIVGLPHVGTFTLINAEGKVLNFSRSWPIPDIDVTDRDFFVALQSNARLNFFISKPIRNRATGTWVVQVARKLSGANGEFLGLVTAAIELQSIEEFFATIALEPNSAISLLHRDGELLARYPHVESFIGRPIPNGIVGDLAPDADRGVVWRVSAIGSQEDRMIAAHRTAHYPLVVAVSATARSILAGWENEAMFLAGAGGLIAIMIVVMVFRIVRQLLRGDRRFQRDIDEQKQHLDTALNNMSQGLCMFDAEARLVICNDRYVRMYSLSREVVKPGCTLRDLIVHRKETGSFPGDVEQYCAGILAAVARGKTASQAVETTGGRTIQIVDQPMQNGGWVATHEDITERRNAERERDHNREFLDLIIENVPATIFVKEADSRRFVLVNRSGEQFWGLPRGALLGKTAYDVFPKEEADQITRRDDHLLRSDEPVYLEEHPLKTPGNGVRIVTSKRLAVRSHDGKGQYLIGVVEDVTERKRAVERIAYLAHHDALTDLPNRPAFTECLASVLERSAAAGEHFAVLAIDLDRFKEVNDVFGHSVGDTLLREVSRRLQTAVGGAFLARVGGDEFSVITTDDAQGSTAEAIAVSLLDAVADNIDIEGRQLRVGLSIGIAVYPANGADATTLLGNADAALYRAKAEARGSIRFFDADLDQQLRDQRTLQHDLSSAIEKGELSLHYQPLAKLSGEVLGFEALLRWHHPIRGMVPPATFIPLAEKSGLIMPIGEWVLRQACVEAASWPKPLRIGVNLSPMQFHHRDLPQLVHSVLLETGLSPNRLELEITESVLIDDFSRGISLLRRLKALGVRIVMDDFGTGYSSLSYLHAFPFDKIKIDQLFISDLEHNGQSATIVRAVIGLARGLGLPVAAEGVETEGQRAFLAREGCNEVQGYLLGRPYRIEDYAELTGRMTIAKQKPALAG